MGSKQLHVFFFPYMAHGHMIPALDLAKLFASRGVKATIVTTPLNVPYFSKSIQRANDMGFQMSVRTIRFPAAESGLPENCEHFDQFTCHDMAPLFFIATANLKQPLEELLEECRPDCLVADMFFPWATGAAARFGIPRLVFHGMGFFPLCTQKSLSIHQPQVLILDHEAVGGFVTHCGWNSIMEGVCAGLPLVTWPSFGEQFLNEKLVTQMLRVGVGVDSLKWAMIADGIGREAISKAIEKIMTGEEAEEMRKRARALKVDAKKAMEEGGSSHSDLNALLQELTMYQMPQKSSD